MNKTKQEKWQRAYGDTPDSFRQRVAASLPKGEESRHVAFPRRAMVLAAALVLVLTTAYAAVVTHTELVWNAGHPIENEADDRLGLLTGKAGTSGDSLTIGGVSRSDRLMHAKSHVSGEPSTAPPEQAAVMPGITSTSRFGSCSQSSSSRLAMPYTPASPEDTTATVLPCFAASTAALQRKTSRVMPDSMRSLPEMRFSIKSRYRP